MSDEIIITYEMGGGLIKRKKLKREKKKEEKKENNKLYLFVILKFNSIIFYIKLNNLKIYKF